MMLDIENILLVFLVVVMAVIAEFIGSRDDE